MKIKNYKNNEVEEFAKQYEKLKEYDKHIVSCDKALKQIKKQRFVSEKPLKIEKIVFDFREFNLNLDLSTVISDVIIAGIEEYLALCVQKVKEIKEKDFFVSSPEKRKQK